MDGSPTVAGDSKSKKRIRHVPWFARPTQALAIDAHITSTQLGNDSQPDTVLYYVKHTNEAIADTHGACSVQPVAVPILTAHKSGMVPAADNYEEGEQNFQG